MARSSTFVSVPPIPTNLGGNISLTTCLGALLENVSLLTGQRGDDTRRALLRGQITVPQPPEMKLRALSANGSGFTISDVRVPSLEDYQRLVQDVQTLASDVVSLRAHVAVLTAQLKA